MKKLLSKLKKDKAVKTNRFKYLYTFMAIFGLIGVLALVSSFAATGLTLDSTLPAPTNVKAYVDDRNTILTWDKVSNNRVIGYYITYRPKGSTEEFKVRQTEYEAIQLQPLINGQQYEVYVQSASGIFKSVSAGSLVYSGSNKWGVADGKVSNKSSVVYFTPSSARVDLMRQRLTGFFDDFNTVAGPMDELKWNQATTACARAGSAAAFVNDQFHAHNTVGSAGPNDSYCDRAGIVSRPRATFDMSNITESNPGQIEFDIDGATHHRDTWYLDVIPLSARTNKAPLDITSHATSDDSDSDNPGNMLRFNAAYDKFFVNYYSPDQSPGSLSLFNGSSACYQSWMGAQVARYDACNLSEKTGNFSPLQEPSIPGFPIPNVRRHWVIQFTPTKIRVYIDSSLMAVANMPASFISEKKFTVHSTLFSYNTGKTDGFDPGPIPSIQMLHWDNFGFNGPSQAEVNYSYLEGGATGTNPTYANGDINGYRIPSGSRKTIIPIPDPIGNIVNNQALFYYTIGGFGFNSMNWTSGDHILVNGKRYDVPNPTTQMAKVSNPLADSYRVAAFTLAINKSDLKQGNNDVEFKFANSGASFINVHLELPYLKSDNTKPTYTQPMAIFGTKFQDIIQPPMMNCDQYRYVEQDLGLPYQSGKTNLTTQTACAMLPKGAHNNTGTGGTTTVPPPANQPPTITLNASSANATAPASYTLTTTASDADGTITKIEIFQDNNSQKTCNATSCTLNITNKGAGSYNYTAVATDNTGSTTTSQAKVVVVSEPTPPPTSSDKFTTLPVNANLPSDAECASRVRPVAEVRPTNQAPNNTRGVGGNYNNPRVTGNYTGTTDEIIQWGACKWGMDEDILRAQMVKESGWFQSAIGDFTSGGASLCSPVYPPGNYPPQYNGDSTHNNQCPESYGLSQVRWTYHKSAFYTSPTENLTTLTNNAIYSTAYNVDYWGSVWRTCFNGDYGWLNDVEKGQNYSSGDEWGCLGVWFSGRWYTQPANEYISAVQDNLANKAWEQDWFLNLEPSNTIPNQNNPQDTQPPTVSISSPANNATVSGTININANAADNVGVVRVSYYLDGSSTAFSNDSTAPYSSSWVSSTVANGTHTITASAIDAAGNVTTSSPITVNVQNVVPDTTKPTVSITAPTNNATVYGTITVNAAASDNVGVTKVDLLIDGFTAATDLTSPYSFQLDTTILSEGNHIITTRAYDAANNIQISTPVTINVDNIPPAPVLCQDTTATNVGQSLPCIYTVPPTNPPPATPGDVTGDGKVDRTDLRQLIINYGKNVTTYTSGDVNGDGKVDRADLRILIINYGK